MTTISKRKQLALGIFIFMGLTILVIGIFSIGGQQKVFEKKFTLRFFVEDAEGLQAGNNIWLHGVKVGAVKKISFVDDNKIEITLNIEKKIQSRIFKDAKAKVSTDGFIGNKIVVIYGGSLSTGSVVNGDILKNEKGVSTNDVLSTFQLNNKNLVVITENIKEISEKINNSDGMISRLINDKNIFNDLQRSILNIEHVTSKTLSAANNLNSFTYKLDTSNGLLKKLLLDTVVFKNLVESVQEVKYASHSINLILDTLKITGAKLKEKNTPFGMLLTDTTVANNLKEIIINMKTSSEKLDQDLEAIQHNFLFKGYFKRKNK